MGIENCLFLAAKGELGPVPAVIPHTLLLSCQISVPKWLSPNSVMKKTVDRDSFT